MADVSGVIEEATMTPRFLRGAKVMFFNN